MFRLRFLLATTLAAALLLPASALAQTRPTYGVQGGVNFAKITFSEGNPDEPSLDFDRRTLGVGGFFTTVDVNERTSVQIDVLYSQKGAKTTFTDEDGTFNVEARLDYLEIPVLVRGTLVSADNMAFRVFGGPAIGVRVADDLKFSLDGVDISDEDDTEWKRLDFGVVVGASVQVGRFVVDARYTHGLVNVIDDLVENIKTRTIGVMVGFAFN